VLHLSKPPLSFEIKTVTNLIKRRYYTAAKRHGADDSTGVHGFVIRYLYRNADKDIYQKDIEEALTIRRSTATNILNLMEKKQLISREPMLHDKRLKKIVLTEKGTSLHESMLLEAEQIENQLLYGLSEEETRLFIEILGKIKKNIE
jgi:DNA-binding MarR family transcriptional regulator